MANIAIVLTHNKSSKENFNQIEAIKPLVKRITDTNEGEDEEGNPTTFDTYHYEMEGLNGYEVRFFQIVPFGVDRPENMNDIDSHNVIYGLGDEDKVADHPRFFNWGLKRATDYGAEAVIHVEDYKKFSVTDLAFQFNTLIDPNDKTEFVEDEAVKITSVSLLKEVGQLDEAKSMEQAIIDLKQRNIDQGGKNG